MLKPETVERALREIQKGYAQYQHFFEQLKSPSWLIPLWEKGCFKEPPAPQPEGDVVRVVSWPESRYLVRMAHLPEARETVLKIVLGIPETENPRVHDDLAEIALSLQPGQAVQLVPQACGWAQSPWKLLLASKLGNLIAHLASGGEGEAALRLARATLELRPDPRAAQREAEDSLLSPEPQPWFSTFDYGRIIQQSMNPLVQATGLEAVRLFRDLLNEVIELSRKRTEQAPEDYTYIWHPAVEHCNDPDRLLNLLLCAVRDSAELAIKSDPKRFGTAINLLREKKWVAFRRLELHLSRVFPQEGRAFADQVFEVPDILDDSSTRHEAVLLLKAVFPALSADRQQELLSWMDTGPGDDYGRRWLEFTQQPVTPESIQALANDWRRDHLAILQGQLPPPYEKKLEELIAKTGAARPLDQVRRATTGGAFGPRSPKAAEELGNMQVQEVLDFLKSWTPTNTEDIFQPNAEGLGRSLTATVKEHPREFADASTDFRGLDPTYVRCFFDGLTAALKAGGTFDWPKALELAVWVAAQPREIPGRRGSLFTNDPDWGWTRDSILSLLTAGFEENPGKLLPEHRVVVWKALRPLTEDSSLSPDQEKSEQFDPAFLAINSTRGRAFEAAIQYAHWVRGATRSPGNDKDWKSRTFADMPEVKEVLEERLDIAKEPTLTVRSIFGRHLQTLAGLDWSWLEAQVSRIFPLGSDTLLRFHAAWDSYVTHWQPHGLLLPLLRRQYCWAVENIAVGKSSRQQTAADHSLGQHLLAYFWWGELDFGEADHLLDDFYEKASDSLRGQTMWFIGTSVSHWDDKTPPEAYERLRALAERRIKAAGQAQTLEGFAQELAGFGWWFTSKKFTDDWSLRTLLVVLRLTKKTQSEMDVVKRLVELCSKYPSECIACLHLMVEGDRDGWLLVGVEKDAKEAIRLALNSSNPESVTAAQRLAEHLIAKGNVGFRDLIS